MSKQERKRLQEQRRRDEFKDSIGGLLETLLQHDEDFLEFQQRTGKDTTLKRSVDKKSKGSSINESFPFNRVELVNQASFRIKKMAEENQEYRNLINKVKKEGDLSIKGCNMSPLRKRKRVYYHHGIGPMEDNTKACVVDPIPTVNKDTGKKINNKQLTQLSHSSDNTKEVHSFQHGSIAPILQDKTREEVSYEAHHSMLESPPNLMSIFSDTNTSNK